MIMKYYVNYNDFEDDNPHWGEYDQNTQEMVTGKTNTYETEIKQEAVDFLFDNFGLDFELEII